MDAGADLRRRGHRCFDRLFSEPPWCGGDGNRADRAGLRGLRQIGRFFGTRLVRRQSDRSTRSAQLCAASRACRDHRRRLGLPPAHDLWRPRWAARPAAAGCRRLRSRLAFARSDRDSAARHPGNNRPGASGAFYPSADARGAGFGRRVANRPGDWNRSARRRQLPRASLSTARALRAMPS